VEYFKCLSSMITNGVTCAREINPELPWQKQRWIRRRILSQANLDLNLRNKIAKWCIWSILLYDAETWELRKVDQKYLEFSKCGAVKYREDRLGSSCEKWSTGWPPYPRLTAVRKKNIWKIKEKTVHKLQNARQARTGLNMVKSSTPNAPSTWLIFL